MVGLFPTLVIVTPAPAVRLGVKSQVIVSVVMPSSHEILDTFSLERLSGSVTLPPVFAMVAVILMPVPTLMTDIPAPAA
jgi:hypothetical protein